MEQRDQTSGLHDHLGYWLRRLSDQVHTGFERAIARRGVTVAQWTVLIAIYRGDATTPREVARFVDVDGGAVTRLVDRLVAKGLIARQADPSDRRSIRLVLTDRGRELTPELAAIADRNDAAFFGPLSEVERERFADLLTRLLQARGIEVSGRWRNGHQPGDREGESHAR